MSSTVPKTPNQALEMVEDAVTRLMANKAALRKLTSERERAVQIWSHRLTDFVKLISDQLIRQTRELSQKHFETLRIEHQTLTEINKELLSSTDPFSRSSTAESEALNEKIRRISEIRIDPDFNGDFRFLDIDPRTGEISKALVKSSVLPSDLSFLNVIQFDEEGTSSKSGTIRPVASNFKPEDSFYDLEKKRLGVHFYDGDNDEIIKTDADSIDCLDKPEINNVVGRNNHNDVKAICEECGRPMSVLLQIEIAQRKAKNLNNNNDLHVPCLTPNKSHHKDGSAKKNVSFYQKTVILEEETVGDGLSTPKVSEGHIRIKDDDDRRCTRSTVAMSSPPLKGDGGLIHSASKTFQRRLSRGEDPSNGTEKKDKEFDLVKNSCIFGSNVPKLVKTFSLKYQNFGPTSIAKYEKNLYVCSPILKKVAVIDLESENEKGYLKLPNGKNFSNPRNVLCFRNKILVLDEDVIREFHGGKLIKCLFETVAKHFRGLAKDSSVNSNDHTTIFTLEKTHNDGSVAVVMLHVDKEQILKRFPIEDSNRSEIMCRFLAVSTNLAIVSDMGTGKLFKVDLSDEGRNKSQEITRLSNSKMTGVTFDPLTSNFAVANFDGSLDIFTMEGLWIKSLELNIQKPAGILLDGEDLYVADNKVNVIYKYVLSEC